MKIDDEDISEKVAYFTVQLTDAPLTLNELDSKYLIPIKVKTDVNNYELGSIVIRTEESNSVNKVVTVVLYDENKNPLGYSSYKNTFNKVIVSKSDNIEKVSSTNIAERYSDTIEGSNRMGTTFRLTNFFKENPNIKYYSLAKESLVGTGSNGLNLDKVLSSILGISTTEISHIQTSDDGEEKYIMLFFDKDFKTTHYMEVE